MIIFIESVIKICEIVSICIIWFVKRTFFVISLHV